jgi:single-strand DNA-binding protein
MINSVVLGGNLTRDAEVKATRTGSAFVKFSVAVNKWRKDATGGSEVPMYFDCTMWGDRGPKIAPYLTRGKQVTVQGELEQQRYQAQDGTNKEKISIVVREIQWAKSDKPDAGQDRMVYRSEPQPQPAQAVQDDIPF